MRRTINWGVFLIFGVLIAGFIIAGFFVSPDAETDDGHPLNYFFWGMAGMFLVTNGGIILWTMLSNRRRAMRKMTWLDAEATILEVDETGTYINNQPRLRFRLHVSSPVHPPWRGCRQEGHPADRPVPIPAGSCHNGQGES